MNEILGWYGSANPGTLTNLQAAFDGRRIVIFSGGVMNGDDDALVEEARAIGDGGGFGSIIGRNSFSALGTGGEEAAGADHGSVRLGGGAAGLGVKRQVVAAHVDHDVLAGEHLAGDELFG